MKLSAAVSVAAAACLHSLLARAGTVQSSNLALPASAPNDRAAVKQLFDQTYQVYLKFAKGGHDEVTPLNDSFTDPRNGWGASIIDGLDTMAIMGEDLTDSLNFINGLDFSKSKTPSTVSVFESTIRYVGGLLSAYELTGNQHQVLLQKAQQLADKLTYAWVGTNDIPYGYLDFSTNTPTQANSNIAEAGSLTLEFGTLSKYTKNQKYANLALKSVMRIVNLPAPLPGLAAQGIDPSTGASVGGYVTWGGGSDSCFEYYAKYTKLFNPSDTVLIDTWSTAVDSSIKKLLRKSTQGDFSYLGDYDSGQFLHVGSHLACFYGGNWILGGKMLNNQTIVDIGLDLTDACWNTYASTQSGIGPETFAYKSDDGDNTGSSPPTQSQNDFYDKHGFYITGSDYILRPEVLESNFYAWRATGNPKYYQRAQAAVKSFNDYVIYKSNGGAVGLNDVDDPAGGYINETPSFWFAEVLKYLYLTFDDPNNISLDTHVFNTEGHPFKAPAAPSSYGSGKLVSNSQKFNPQSANGPTPPVSSLPGLPTGL